MGSAPWPLGILSTFVLVLLGWVLFRANSLPAAFAYYAGMFGWSAGTGAEGLLGATLYTPLNCLVAAVCALLVMQPWQAYDWAAGDLTWGRVAVALPLLVVGLATMISQGHSPFLYFQF
jgi:alginate O-acetyltransferase complex protein AlgI